MEQKVFAHRKGLVRTLERISEGNLTIGFIGGSITDGRAVYNWPEAVTNWFVEKFPNTRINVENAAIGATGSELAVFRAQRDLIERGCDLIFIEFAVNDGDIPTEKRNNTREGLVRKLLSGKGHDIVFTYTFRQEMYSDMIEGKVPQSIIEFENIAGHYGIGSVWMGLYALNEIRKGRMKWEEWLPDGLHPQSRGSLSYAQSVIAFLEKELITSPNHEIIPYGENLPAPMFETNWENACILPLSEVKTEGPWKIMRWVHQIWMDKVLCTSAVGAKLSFEFEGRGVSLGFDFGKASADFKYRLDGGEWSLFKHDRPDWCGDAGWFKMVNITDSLLTGKHSCEIEVVHGNAPGCKGTNFCLAMIGVIK